MFLHRFRNVRANMQSCRNERTGERNRVKGAKWEAELYRWLSQNGVCVSNLVQRLWYIYILLVYLFTFH